MYERMEFCPKCNANQRMIMSIGLMAIDPALSSEDILLYHYHCAACNTYVRSVPVDQESFYLPDEIAVFSLSAYV